MTHQLCPQRGMCHVEKVLPVYCPCSRRVCLHVASCRRIQLGCCPPAELRPVLETDRSRNSLMPEAGSASRIVAAGGVMPCCRLEGDKRTPGLTSVFLTVELFLENDFVRTSALCLTACHSCLQVFPKKFSAPVGEVVCPREKNRPVHPAEPPVPVYARQKEILVPRLDELLFWV